MSDPKWRPRQQARSPISGRVRTPPSDAEAASGSDGSSDSDSEDDDDMYQQEAAGSVRVGRRATPEAAHTDIFARDEPDITSRSTSESRSPACRASPEHGSADEFEQAVSRAAKRMRAAEDEECDETDNADRRSRAGCWGCMYGATRHEADTDNEDVSGLIRLIRENHGRMDNLELARIVNQYHEERIRQPILTAGGSCGEWRTRAVLRHLRHHTLDPSIVIGENIRALRVLMRVLRRRTMETDVDTGLDRVDARNVDLLLKTVKSMSDLYARRPDSLLFGSSNSEYMVAAKSHPAVTKKR